jgi:hypothetical protein
MPGHNGQVKHISGSMETGAGTTSHMYMFRKQVIGRNHDRVTHMLKEAGRLHLKENHGQKVIGKKIIIRIIYIRRTTRMVTIEGKNSGLTF